MTNISSLPHRDTEDFIEDEDAEDPNSHGCMLDLEDMIEDEDAEDPNSHGCMLDLEDMMHDASIPWLCWMMDN